LSPEPLDSDGMGLKDVLARLGLALRPSRPEHYRKVLDGETLLIDGNPSEIWDWLRATGRIK
jgi:hypothetical protein